MAQDGVKMPDTKRVGNRDKLLRAALVCLRDRGYAHTTARDLVAVSGTNLNSIGYHFGGKEALLHEAVAESMMAWIRQIEAEAFSSDGQDGPGRRLERFLGEMVDRFDEHEAYLVAFVEAFPPAVRSPELRERLAAAYDDARVAGADIFERSFESAGASIDRATLEVLASLVLALCDGLILQWLLDPDRAPRSNDIMEALHAAAPTFVAAPDGAVARRLGFLRSKQPPARHSDI